MRRYWMSLLVLGLMTSLLGAQGPAEEYAALKKKVEDTQKQLAEVEKELVKAFQAAKTEEERQAIVKKAEAAQKATPLVGLADGFLSFAEKNPKAPEAFDALFDAMRLGGGPFAKNGKWEKALSLFQANHLKDERMVNLVRALSEVPDFAIGGLIEEVAKTNPSRKVQARAYQALAQNRQALAELAERAKKEKAILEGITKQLGKEFVEKLQAVDSNKFAQQAEAFSQLVKDKYNDVIPDLSLGKVAPEVNSQDLEGKKVKLSDLRGKVVVLDVWATWCPPCRAMIPHSREMVKRLKDMPFTLVSVSGDDASATVKEFIKEFPMPWTHWWNGTAGGMIEDWDIQSFPTIFVLDAKGVIRHRDLRDKPLEDAVVKLLEEMGQKVPPAAPKEPEKK